MIQWSRASCILLLMTTAGVVSPLKCPSSASAWDRASRGLQCQPPNFYHCLRDESGVITEQCLPRVWIQPQMCPEFNSRVSRVDVYQCTVTNCPTSLYWSNAVFMYPICFENGSATSSSKPGSTVTTTVLEKTSLFEYHSRSTKATIVLEQTPTFDMSKDSGDEPPTDKSLPVGAIIGSIVGVVVVCVVGVLIILVYYKRRHRKGNNGGLADGNVRIEYGKLSGNGSSSEPKMESIKDGCHEEQVDGNGKSEANKPRKKVEKGSEINETKYLLKEQGDGNVKIDVSKPSVYVVENQDQTSVPKDESFVRVLMLVLYKPVSKTNMDSKARETFGKKYGYCRTLPYYQIYKQKESVSLFPQNFDFESVKEICERIRDEGLERDVNFVITVPFSVWSAQRDELSSFLDEERNLSFKTEYC